MSRAHRSRHLLAISGFDTAPSRYVQSTEHAATATPRVVAWTPEQFAARVDEAMDIYVRAMNYPPTTPACSGQ